jgi:hypothetical protein
MPLAIYLRAGLWNGKVRDERYGPIEGFYVGILNEKRDRHLGYLGKVSA